MFSLKLYHITHIMTRNIGNICVEYEAELNIIGILWAQCSEAEENEDVRRKHNILSDEGRSVEKINYSLVKLKCLSLM